MAESEWNELPGADLPGPREMGDDLRVLGDVDDGGGAPGQLLVLSWLLPAHQGDGEECPQRQSLLHREPQAHPQQRRNGGP